MKAQTVAKGAGIIMAGTLLSRLLGYVRDKAIAYNFIPSHDTDAYWSAFAVPDLLYYLLAGGALSAAFIPVFTSYLAKKQDSEAQRIASTVANLLMILSSIGIVIWIWLAPYLVRIVAPGYGLSDPRYLLCVRYSRIVCPMVFFTTLSALATGILNSYRHFTAPALAWSIYNVGIICGAFFLGPSWGIMGLCIGVVLGAAGMVLIQVPVMIRGGFRYLPILDLKHPGVKQVGKMFLPLMISLGLSQIMLLLMPQIMGSFFPERSVTILRYANRLIILPLGLFAVSIATAAFPTMSLQALNGASPEFKQTLSASFRAILVLSIPACVGLMVLHEPIVRLLWHGGGYDEAATKATGFALFFFAIGLIGHSSLQILNRAFYSLQNVLIPATASIGCLGLNILLVAWLYRTPVSYGSVAVASSAAILINMVLILVFLRWRIGRIGGREIATCFGKVLLASLIMGRVCYLIANALGVALGVPIPSFTWQAPNLEDSLELGPGYSLGKVAIQLASSMAAGILILLLMFRVFRVREIEMAWERLSRKLGILRKKAVPSSVGSSAEGEDD